MGPQWAQRCEAGAHYTSDKPLTVHCALHYLCHCSWALFTNTVKKKKKKEKTLGNLWRHNLVLELRYTNT